MSEKIKEALGKLDINNDEHWTTEGLPRLDVMKDLLNGEAVSRAEITAAVKGFSRKTPNLEAEEPENTGSGESADAQTTKPETTEDTTPPAPTEDGESEDKQESEPERGPLGEYNASEVEKELEDARANFAEAQKRFDQAKAAMDVVIRQREKSQEGRTTAHDIKAYQASQAKQREATAQNRKAMVEAINATKTKF